MKSAIDRQADAEALLELLHAPANRARMRHALVVRRTGDVAEGDRHDHAVQGLARPGPAQQIEEGIPAGAIDGGIRILGRIAAGRVDQHGILGEPPVAEPRAADAGDRPLPHLGGQRELQAAVQQRRRLAGAGRPDDDVPGLLVEVAARAARPLQQRQRGRHPVAKGRRFLVAAVVRLVGGLLGDAALELLLAAAAIEVEHQVRGGPDRQQAQDDDQAGHPAFEKGSSGPKNQTSSARMATPTKLSTQREARNRRAFMTSHPAE